MAPVTKPKEVKTATAQAIQTFPSNAASANWNYYSPAIHYPNTGGGSYIRPNITWQQTSSGATYSSAANVLK